MSTLKDGGPAFPSTAYPGMSLRDYFAAMAMAALIAEPMWEEGSKSLATALTEGDGSLGLTRYARAAYKIADAMLAERERTDDA